MSGVEWGEPASGVRFGVRTPAGEVEAGSTVRVEAVCENDTGAPVHVFGFSPDYPRALRVSPPKPHRPYIRVSFADVNVLHPPEAFIRLLPGATVHTGLDLSFAFDRRGAGRWPVAFGYDPVRAAGGLVPYQPPREGVESGVAELVVVGARSLREAGITEATEAALDDALLRGDADIEAQIRALDAGGVQYLCRRIGRVLSPDGGAVLGWRALDALTLLGPEGAEAARRAADEMPHAAPALRYAADWTDHRAGLPPEDAHMPFMSQLDRMIDEPEARGNLVLTWTAHDSPVHGLRRVEIFGDGSRIVTHKAPGRATVPETRRTRMLPRESAQLLKALRYSAAWLLRSLRERGLPDEPRPALEIQLALGDPFVRRVAMWNGEWREGPASTLAGLLDRLAS